MTRAHIDHEARENIIHSAMIRAALCAARGISESQACHPPGVPAAYAGTHRPAASCDQPSAHVCASADSVRCRTQCEHCAPPVRECQMCGATDPAHRAVCEQMHPGVCDWTECDTEGGSHD